VLLLSTKSIRRSKAELSTSGRQFSEEWLRIIGKKGTLLKSFRLETRYNTAGTPTNISAVSIPVLQFKISRVNLDSIGNVLEPRRISLLGFSECLQRHNRPAWSYQEVIRFHFRRSNWLLKDGKRNSELSPQILQFQGLEVEEFGRKGK
jgi:hypothetical protein